MTSADAVPEGRKIVTFGEAMLRLSATANVSLERAETLSVELAGSEANVAIALARLGIPTAWVSSLPDNALGRRALNTVRAHGVDVSGVRLVPEGRMGLYFVELAARPRTGQVIYDRADSAFAHMGVDGYPPEALDGAGMLHLSGINAALGAGARAAALRAMQVARKRNIPVSFDLNVRTRLAPQTEWREICDTFAAHAEILFVNSRDAETVLGFSGPAEGRVEALKHRYPHALCVMTHGAAGAYAFDTEIKHCAVVPGDEIDRIGRGDAFCAGFLWGYLERDTAYGLRCGTALAALKQTYHGDIVWATRDDLLRCLQASFDLER